MNVAESSRIQLGGTMNVKSTVHKGNTRGKRRHFIHNQIQAHHWVAVNGRSHAPPTACPLSEMLQLQEGSGITPSTHLRRMLEESTGFPLVHLNWMWSLWGAYSVSFNECMKAMLCVVMMALFTVQGPAGHRGKTI